MLLHARRSQVDADFRSRPSWLGHPVDGYRGVPLRTWRLTRRRSGLQWQRGRLVVTPFNYLSVFAQVDSCDRRTSLSVSQKQRRGLSILHDYCNEESYYSMPEGWIHVVTSLSMT
ncbi:MAG: hypothetical protein CM15mP18_0700 [Methanobacteriota archaeon]|nr:MAG: hypothetical protein CM15mP18_0700 [Euryarchaeota archaeon]